MYHIVLSTQLSPILIDDGLEAAFYLPALAFGFDGLCHKSPRFPLSPKTFEILADQPNAPTSRPTNQLYPDEPPYPRTPYWGQPG